MGLKSAIESRYVICRPMTAIPWVGEFEFNFPDRYHVTAKGWVWYETFIVCVSYF